MKYQENLSVKSIAEIQSTSIPSCLVISSNLTMIKKPHDFGPLNKDLEKFNGFMSVGGEE
jgi:hypothetical protein